MRVSKASVVRRLLASGETSVEMIAERAGVAPGYVRTLRRYGTRRKDHAVTQTETKKEKQATFLEHLVRCNGIFTDAARRTGISLDRPWCWMREDVEFAAKVKEIKEISIDFVESSLFRQIQNEVPSSTIFFLKTRAKHRGYVERIEHSGPEGRPMEIRVILPSVDYVEQAPEPGRELPADQEEGIQLRTRDQV